VGRLEGAASGGALPGRFEGEFDGIDARYLLPGRLREFPGDASVGGVVAGSVTLRNPAGAHGLIKDVSGRLDLTHIGPEALDRALLSLDPEALNPGIVGIRNRLGLASPRRVRVELRRGFVGGQVELVGLVGGIVGTYAVPRFGIADALGSTTLERMAAVGRWLSAMRPVLDVLGARRIVLMPEGGVELR